MKLVQLLGVILLATLSFSAAAHEYDAGSIHIIHPWARATVPGQPSGGAYLKLENKGAAADKLISASSDVAGSVELHTMSMAGDVMKMEKVDGVELPAGKTTEFKPGSFHIMLFNLKAPLKEGSRFPLTLKFAKAGEVKVDVVVQAIAAGSPVEEHKH